jgi:hypothetical protein
MNHESRPVQTTRESLATCLLWILAVWGFLVAAVVAAIHAVAGSADPDARAIVRMGLGLIVIWCLAGGLTMRLARRRFTAWSRRLPLDWRLRFVILCILMALLEEGVTTALTNAGPLLGAATAAARITSSTNYLEVIRGSVLVFIPWFICWAWLLGRYDFRPLEVMLLFGLTGTLAETITYGPSNLAGIGMWVYVYGLMVYLPVQTVPENRSAKPVRWYHAVMAVLLPLVFIFPFVVVVVVRGAKLAVAFFRGDRRKESGS